MQGLSSFQKSLQDISLSQQLMLSAGVLFCIGVIMIGSASMGIASAKYGSEFYFLLRHIIWLAFGSGVALVVLMIPISFWEKNSKLIFIAGLLILIVVLIPGIGKRVNGSSRWINIGPLNMQPSEAAKLAIVIYMASYLVRFQESIRAGGSAFYITFALLGAIALFLLLEPDFGATMVISVAVMGMVFLAGVPVAKYVVSTVVLGGLAGIALTLEEYRLSRLKTFLDPWKEKFDDGYQLTQSLIAFGRGDWLGVGLGKSAQKMFYLPEAHTDFVFAIYAEEFGLVGIFLLLSVFAFFVYTIMRIGRKAELNNKLFSAYLAYGIGFLIVTQVTVNICVNMGLLPTKGLTLPLISYGGSSMAATFAMLALLLRIEKEGAGAAPVLKGARS